MASIEIFVIFALILANACFAMTEIAIISSRKSRLKQMASEGYTGAKSALHLAQTPSVFLPTVQTGITTVGVVNGVFGGFFVAERLSEIIARASFLAPYSEPLAFGIVVAIITYFTLVLGELVPKRLALAYAETISAAAAKPMLIFSYIAYPMVRLLSVSHEFVLRLMGFKSISHAIFTEEEIKYMIQQGAKTGAFEPRTGAICEHVFNLGALPVREIMRPLSETPYLDLDKLNTDNIADLHRHALDGSMGCLPVVKGGWKSLQGVAPLEALLDDEAIRKSNEWHRRLKPPHTISIEAPALQLIELFAVENALCVMAIDDRNRLQGVVTQSDMIRAFQPPIANNGRTTDADSSLENVGEMTNPANAF